ncbi:hypothetical protein GCM10028862_13670 [Luteimonas pelagia]
MPTHAIVALVFAASSLPAFLVARLLGGGRLPLTGNLSALRDDARRDLDRRLAVLMRAVGWAILVTAGGIWWAAGDTTRTTAVVVLMAVVVNALAVLMLVAVARSRRQGTPRR